MPEPRPDPGPVVEPIGIDTGHKRGGVKSLAVATSAGDGLVVVSSDAMLSQLASLARLSDSLSMCARDLAALIEQSSRSTLVHSDVRPALLDADHAMQSGLRLLRGAASRAESIHAGILRAQREYARTEQTAMIEVHRVDEYLAWEVGEFVRAIAIPAGMITAEMLLADKLFFGLSVGELALGAQSFLKQHGRILTNPLTVAAVREVASDVDGFTAGLAGIPQPIASALERAGVTGVKTSAGEVVTVGRLFGAFDETPVAVRRTSTFDYASPPSTLFDRASAFPDAHSDPNGEQFRIDRYVTPGQSDRFDVYISGTVTFDARTGSQPFDFTSDLRGVAGQSTASATAVERAMEQAGITPSTPVVLNGYSQGGLVASMIAASGRYDVKGVVTFGAPSGQVHVPATIPVLTIRNTEDLVPATSGYDVNPNAVVVTRSVFADQPVPSEWAVPAHRLETYQQTASVVDTAASPQVRGILDSLDAFGTGVGHVESSLWVATRTSESPAVPIPAMNVTGRGAVAG